MIPEGQHLAEFEIMERLGEDGVGESYKARQTAGGQLVRLTVLPLSLAGDADYAGRFHREGGAVAGLRHANLVSVIGVGEAAGVHYHAAEFVADETAEARIKRKGRIGAANAIAMVVHVANALEHVWKEAGLIHRDLRAGNIFISREGGVKLGGLGLARRFGKAGGLAADIPHFISPEEAEGKDGNDIRANIYSLGCILFHMVSGRVPFEGDDAAVVAMRHASEPAPDARTVWSGCAPKLAAVLKRTMEKSPEARYQNYDELGVALRVAYEALSAAPLSAASVAPAPAPVVVPAAAPVPRATAQPAPVPSVSGPATVRLGPASPATVRAGFVSPATVPLAPRPPEAAIPGAPPRTAAPMSAAPAPSVPSASLFAVRASTAEGGPRKRKLPWILGGVVVAVAAGVMVYFFLRNKRAAGGNGASTAPLESKAGLPKATTAKPFVNSLGMKFVPVRGVDVIVSIWETRVQDYAAFAGAKQVDAGWSKQDYQGAPVGREPLHPVCGVTWDDAKAFCQWLTEMETTEGLLVAGARYRLPTDVEWSHAVGLHSEEGATPRERSGRKGDDFPWGREWPPKAGAGNYADTAYHDKLPKEKMWLEGYTDGFPTTAPAGSFPANEFSIYDLGGNVWEWCEDAFDSGSKNRVLRGAAWAESDRGYLLSSYRIHFAPGSRFYDYGFRCVIAAGEPR